MGSFSSVRVGVLKRGDDVLYDVDSWSPSSRHRDKDAEFVTLCKSLHVTDLVCERSWALWKSVQVSMDEIAVRILKRCVSISS